MVEDLDYVARYATALGLAVLPRTVLVEGTSDVDLFQLAARLEHDRTGLQLVGRDLAIVAAGEGDRGGTSGVIRELLSLRGLARTCLLPNGRPRYRFVGLFDNDKAGKQAVRAARDLDSSLLEYKDIFRLWPVMPVPMKLDPGSVQKTFEDANGRYTGLDWELEDLLPSDFVEVFLSDGRDALVRTTSREGKTHRDLTRDGKARLHYFTKRHAVHSDLTGVVEVLKAMRFYLGLK